MNAALRILLPAALALTARARAEDLLVLEHGPEDHEASVRLRELHDEPSETLADPQASALAHALARGREHRARRVVIFAGPEVTVLDTVSGQQAMRHTADNTAYTAAFVAAELLAIRPPAPAPAPPLQLALRLGAQPWLSPPFPTAVRAELGLALTHVRWRGELFAALPGHSDHAGVQRTRSDLGARAASFVLARERFQLAIVAQLGVAFVRARLHEPGLPSRSRSALAAGVGLEPSLRLSAWLSLYSYAILQASTPRAEYRVAGTQAARESPLGVALGLGLWLTPPFR